jgi:hypothetical protein
MPSAVTQPRPTASQRGTWGSIRASGYHSGVALEPALAALVMLVGIGLTSIGVFAHIGIAIAPGAFLTLVGGGWLGNCLARLDVRLLPGSRMVAHTVDDEVSKN